MTQKEAILSMLKQGERVTPLTALKECGCFRLAARIHDLREELYPIVSNKTSSCNRWGKKVFYNEYWMADEPKL